MFASLILLAALSSAPDDRFTERTIATIPDEVPVYDVTSGANDAADHRCAWSPDGRHVAWIATVGGAPHAAIDGEVGRGFAELDAPLFAPDGSRAAFRGKLPGVAGAWAVVIDDEVVAEAEFIGPLAFSPDGARLAFWEVDAQEDALTCVDAGTGKRWKRGRRVSLVDEAAGLPSFSADGKRVIASAKGAEEHVLVLATRAGSKVVVESKGWLTAPRMSPKGREFAYVEYDEGASPARMFTVRGKKRLSTSMDGGGFGVYSPDGRKFAYLVRKDGKTGVAIDSDSSSKPIYYGVVEIAWHPGSERVAFVANHEGPSLVAANGESFEEGGGMWFAVDRAVGAKDGEEGPGFVEVDALVYIPAGDHLAYRARRGLRWMVVVGEARSEVYDEVGPPVFSPDGTKVAFGARRGRELLWRVLEVPPR